MKPQTPEEIGEQFEKQFGVMTDYFNHRVELFDKMKRWHVEQCKEHTRQALLYALEDAENNGEVDDYSGAKAFIKKSSILSRYESIIKELGL